MRAIPKASRSSAWLTRDDEIWKALPGVHFSAKQKHSRARLDEAVLSLSNENRSTLEKAADEKRKRRKIQTDERPLPNPSHSSQTVDGSFLRPVSENVRRERISKFIDATGNAATKTSICAVCAGRFFDSDISALKLCELQTDNILLPSKSHPSHVLTHGMLLHQNPDCFHNDANGIHSANVCFSCASHVHRNKTPPLSLANGMWVGAVPGELDILPLPERILVGRHFPAAYIVKLYPKKRGANSWCSKNLQSGLRGNVSTYRLNTEDIASMTDAQSCLLRLRSLRPPLVSLLLGQRIY
ncbi:hypothetical protein EDB85DRAFT_1922716 [Lactarius pseudohatsudake]|nr:hypothetical protein EDB85DRAFT_1922716 [Lactarius pseudohatsudake]